MKITRRLSYAAAALIVVGVLTGILMPDSFSPQQAFAQMVANVRDIGTAIMRMTVIGQNDQQLSSTLYLKNPGRLRQEAPAINTVTVFDFAAGKMLTLLEQSHTAAVTDLPTGWTAQSSMNIVEAFRQMNTNDGQLVGQTTEDGRTLLIYEVKHADLTMRIWMDKKTLLPARIRTEATLPGQAEPTVMVMDQMQWDPQLSDSLFSVAPPPGYHLSQATLDLGAPGPQDMVRLLRLWTTLTNGQFPDELSSMSMYQIAGAFGEFNQRIHDQKLDSATEYLKLAKAIDMNVQQMDDNSSVEFQQKIQGIAGRGATLMGSYQSRQAWHWTGKGAHLGDPNRIVCYWQETDGQYAGIDANLNLVTLNADQLPRQ